MIIVNDKNNLPISIKQITLTEINKKFLLTKSFLDVVTEGGKGHGIKRENYWILNTEGNIRILIPTPPGDYQKFLKLLESCNLTGFQLLMILLK